MCSDVPPDVYEVVVVAEALDLDGRGRVRRLLEEAHRRRPQVLVLDLEDCTCLGVAGLGLLLEAHRRTRARGATLIVRGAGPRLQSLLSATRLRSSMR